MTGQNVKTHRFNFSTRMLVALPSILALCLIFAPSASASYPGTAGSVVTSIAPAPNGGFWVQVDDGVGGRAGTYAINGAPDYGSVPLSGIIVAEPAGPNGWKQGYWVVTKLGGIAAKGGAVKLCEEHLSNCSGFSSDPLPKDYIVTAAAKADGLGLWAVDRNGRVWTAGTAVSYGDVTNDSNTPTGIVGTPSGDGYYIVLEDGGVYSFGDAKFFGSTGGEKPGGHNVTGIAPSYNLHGEVNGYWLVAEDGAVYTYGDAPFLGNGGPRTGGRVTTSITTRGDGRSYAWVHADGQIGLSETIPSVMIQSRQYGSAIGLDSPSQQNGYPLELVPANGSDLALWDVWPKPNTKFAQLVNVNSGLCLDLEGNHSTGRITQFACKGKSDNPDTLDNQLWELRPNVSGITVIQPYSWPAYHLIGNSGGGVQVAPTTQYDSGWFVSKANSTSKAR